MPTPHTEAPRTQSDDLIQLRAELAAFNKEVSRQTPINSHKVWLPFGLGAGMALTVYVVVSLMGHLA